MNDFDRRWQACARRAGACPEDPPAADPALAARVVAAWQAGRARAALPLPIERLAGGFLAAAACLLAALVVRELRPPPGSLFPDPTHPAAPARILWPL